MYFVPFISSLSTIDTFCISTILFLSCLLVDVESPEDIGFPVVFITAAEPVLFPVIPSAGVFVTLVIISYDCFVYISSVIGSYHCPSALT